MVFLGWWGCSGPWGFSFWWVCWRPSRQHTHQKSYLEGQSPSKPPFSGSFSNQRRERNGVILTRWIERRPAVARPAPSRVAASAFVQPFICLYHRGACYDQAHGYAEGVAKRVRRAASGRNTLYAQLKLLRSLFAILATLVKSALQLSKFTA